MKIAERLDAYDTILRGGVGLFDASDDVSREEWHRYVSAIQLTTAYRGVLGVGFAEWVPPEVLDAHVRKVRAEGHPGYAVRPPGARDAYTAIVYLEPFSGRNLRAFGFDMWSEPVRRAAMERARDTGGLATSGRVTLVQETDADVQPGVLTYLAVYTRGPGPRDVEERRGRLRGWVYSPLRAHDLMRGILGPGPGPIRVRVHDGPDAGDGNLLWDSAPGSREPERVSYSAPIEVNGRTWTARFTAGDAYVGALGLRSSAVDAAAMALGVVLITALTGGLVASTRGRRREAALAASLRESEARYRTIFERAPVGIFVVAPDDRYVRVNPRYCEITGRTEEELLGMRWHDVVHPDDRDRDAEPIRELREGRRAWVSLERRGVRKDGSTFWATTTFSLESGGRPAAAPLVGVMEDVTTRHEAEARFRDIAERAVAGILIIQDDRVVYANPAAATILGKAPEEILTSGESLIDALVLPEDAPAVRRDRELQLRDPDRMAPFLAYRILRPDGAVRLVERTARTIQHGGRRATLMTLTDVTERERTAAEMQKAQRLESLGVLAGGIAHDFNNLLTAVFGGIEEARSLAGAGSEVARELDDAVAALARARDLTRQLLTFAAGGAPERRLVDLRRSLEAAAQLALGGSQVRARLEVPASLPDVEADEGQLSQLWSNLLLNARQATAGAGDVTIRARLRRNGEVHVEGLEAGSYVEVQVADAGHGIAPEVLPRVFDPFFTTRDTGTGLGLSVCYSIVRRHGGHLGITSRVGDGTVVTVLLPAADGKASSAPPPAPSPLPGRLRVLLMDDEPLVRKVGEKHLRKLGLEVTAVADGQEAVEAWRRAREAGSPFDVALLDLTVVGGMGGAEAAKAIRRLDPGAVTVACSGYFEDAVMAEPERYGFDGVLAKPYLTEDLQAVLARAGGRGRAPRETK